MGSSNRVLPVLNSRVQERQPTPHAHRSRWHDPCGNPTKMWHTSHLSFSVRQGTPPQRSDSVTTDGDEVAGSGLISYILPMCPTMSAHSGHSLRSTRPTLAAIKSRH